MKYLLAVWIGLVPVQDESVEPITISPAERSFIVLKFQLMQKQIDDLEKALRTEKDRTGCA